MARARTGWITQLEDGRWLARYQYTDKSGKRRNVKRIAESEDKAKGVLRKLLNDHDQTGGFAVEGDRLTFGKLASIYAERKIIKARYQGDKKIAGRRSVKPVEVALTALKEHFSSKRLKSITHSDVEQYKLDRLDTPTKYGTQRSIATVNRELELLRAMLRFAIRQGWLVRSPFEMGDPLISKADETRRERTLTHEEEIKLLDACSGRRAHLRALVITALDTAARRGELFKLKWSDVDFNNDVIRLRATTTKTATARTIGMTPRVREELMKLWLESAQDMDDTVFGYGKENSTIKTAWKSACRAAGVDSFRFHDLRHTATTRLVQTGVPSTLVMKITGHTQHVTFARYVNPNDDSVRQAADALSNFNAQARVQQTSD